MRFVAASALKWMYTSTEFLWHCMVHNNKERFKWGIQTPLSSRKELLLFGEVSHKNHLLY